MFLHEHRWVQVKNAWWEDKEDKERKGFFLFCETCHATCRVCLFGDMPEFEYVKKENRVDDVSKHKEGVDTK